MRKFLATFFAALFFASQASAGFLLNPFILGSVTASPYAVSYLGTLSWASGTVITGAINIGAADANKEIFVISIGTGGSTTSGTVDGVAVTLATQTTNVGVTGSAMFAATPTSSGSVTVTINYTSSPTVGRVAVYKVLSRPNAGATDTDANTATSNPITINTVTINNNGIWFSTHYHQSNNATTGPSGTVINDNDANNGAYRMLFSHRDVEVTGSTPSDVWSWTTGSGRAYSWAFD